MFFSPDLHTTYRQTYSMLDWLGDLGGLLDALLKIGTILVFPFSTYAADSRLLNSLFRYRKSNKS